jgi:hypothetical protein
VSCAAAAACMAVDSYVYRYGHYARPGLAYAEAWDGRKWQVIDVPHPDQAPESELAGSHAPPPRGAWLPAASISCSRRFARVAGSAEARTRSALQGWVSLTVLSKPDGGRPRRSVMSPVARSYLFSLWSRAIVGIWSCKCGARPSGLRSCSSQS